MPWRGYSNINCGCWRSSPIDKNFDFGLSLQTHTHKRIEQVSNLTSAFLISYQSFEFGGKIEVGVNGWCLRRRLIRKRWLKNWIGGIVHLWQIRMGRNQIGKGSEEGKECRTDEGQNSNIDLFSPMIKNSRKTFMSKKLNRTQGEQKVVAFTGSPYSY